MIVADTSAIMAILLGEERGMGFSRAIEEHRPALVSAGTAIELAIVSSRNARLFDAAMAFLQQPFVRIEPVDAEQVALAAKAYRRFGKGRHPARLNFGDMFAYALARRRNLPLLFKGSDFTKTDISPVVVAMGRHSRQDPENDGDPALIVHQRKIS